MFENRQDAGRRLAARLLHLADQAPVVLGLPRGGVVVAAEIASTLSAPLDVLVVRKIPAPHQPELALGAVTDGDHPRSVLNQQIIDALGISSTYLDRAIAEQFSEVRRRQQFYRSGRPSMSVQGRTVIVVDDGIATGATVQAGLEALRDTRPKRLVLAVPVGPPESLRSLRRRVDEIAYVSAPSAFPAVGAFYRHFEQTTDQEVIDLLKEAAERRSDEAPKGSV